MAASSIHVNEIKRVKYNPVLLAYHKGKFKGLKGVHYHLLLDKPYGKILQINSTDEDPVFLALEGVDEIALEKQLNAQLRD